MGEKVVMLGMEQAVKLPIIGSGGRSQSKRQRFIPKI
jgi:hypothetical protein